MVPLEWPHGKMRDKQKALQKAVVVHNDEPQKVLLKEVMMIFVFV